MSRTKSLQVTGGINHLSIIGAYSLEPSSAPLRKTGYWSYLCRPKNRHLGTHGLGAAMINAFGGMYPPPPGTQPGNPVPPLVHSVHNPVHPYTVGQPQWPVSTGICDIMQFLHHAELSGVVYPQIEKLELGGTMDDVFYRDILGRCYNVKTLRLTSYHAMHVLVDLINTRLAKSVEEVQMFKFDGTASSLADWVEARRHAGCGVARVFVQVSDGSGSLASGVVLAPGTQIDTDSETRIQACLTGEKVGLVWRTPPRNAGVFGLGSQWADVVEDSWVDWENGIMLQDNPSPAASARTDSTQERGGGEEDEAGEMDLGDWFEDGLVPPLIW